MKIILKNKKGFDVKYVEDNYILKSNETKESLEGFLKPDIIDSKVIETATKDDFLKRDFYNKKTERKNLLEKGVIVDGIWFNEFYLGNFTSAINIVEKNGIGSIDWKNDAGEWVTLTIQEANLIALKSMIKIQEIYKL